MKTGWNTQRNFNLLGGINSATVTTAVEDSQFVDMNNMVVGMVGSYGRIEKRKGRSKYNPTQVNGTANIQGIYDFIRREDDKKRLIAVSGGTVKWLKGDTWTTVVSGLSTTEPFSFTEYINNVLFSNNTDGVYKWDGITDATLISAAPKLSRIMTYKNHIFGFGVKEYPYTLYYSELGDIDVWPAVNIINFDENIVGIAELPNVLAVFTENTIWYITGSDSDDFARQQINPGIGCVSWRTAQVINNEIYFLSKGGVYKIAMTGQCDKVSGNIDDKMKNINPTYFDKAVAVHDRIGHRFILAVPEGTSSVNNKLYIYDYLFNAWTIEDLTCSALEISEEVDGTFHILSGNSAGYVYDHYIGYNDDGTAISAFAESKWIDVSDPTNIHNFKWLNVYYQDQGEVELTVRIYVDWNESDYEDFKFMMNGDHSNELDDFILDVDYLGNDKSISMESILILKRANAIKVKFIQNGSNESFALYGYEFLEKPVGVGKDEQN